jgi:hypothetical protein
MNFGLIRAVAFFHDSPGIIPAMQRRSFVFLVLALVALTAMHRPDLFAQESDEEEERAKYQPYRDYGEDWRWGSLFGITPEDGVLVGTGAIVYKFAFRTFPYLYRMELVGGLTLKTGRFKIRYTATFPDLAKKLSLDLLAYASELEVRNFYGFGNDAPRNKDLERGNFYRVASRQYFIRPELRYKLGRIALLKCGASFKHFEVRPQANRFLTNVPISPLGDDRSVVGTGVELLLAALDTAIAPREGFSLELSAWNFPGLFDHARPFQRYGGDLRGYASAGPATLALRVAAEKLNGSYPFYEAAFLGGAGSLRGYNLNRFAGDGSVIGAAEVRCDLFKLRVLVPTQIGLFVFSEAGRVYLNGNSPKGWHADVGSGISLAPISRDLTFSVSIASSVEGVFVNGAFGFSF